MRRTHSAQTKPVTNQSKPTYSPPEPPKKAFSLAKAYKKTPFLISASQDFIDRLENADPEERQSLLLEAHTDPDNVVVLVGHLKASHLVDYEALEGVDLTVKLKRIQWYENFLMLQSLVNNTSEKEKTAPESKALYESVLEQYEKNKALFEEQGSIVITPYGPIQSNLEHEYMYLTAFVLSRYGRQISDETVEDIEIEEILEYLPADFLNIEENGVRVVLYVLHLAGLLPDPTKNTQIMEADTLLEEDDEEPVAVEGKKKRQPRARRNSA